MGRLCDGGVVHGMLAEGFCYIYPIGSIFGFTAMYKTIFFMIFDFFSEQLRRPGLSRFFKYMVMGHLGDGVVVTGMFVEGICHIYPIDSLFGPTAMH